MANDQLLRGLLYGGAAQFVAISGLHMVETARETHALSRVCTAALGRQLMMTAMMTTRLKRETESVTTIIKADGPCGNIVCTGRYGALVKGFIKNPQTELPPSRVGKLDVSGAVGKSGRLSVARDLSMREPYVGFCDLVSGEIAEDFAQYFTVSEQQPSLVYLGVRVRPENGLVRAAGGILVQPLPGCPEDVIDTLQARADAISFLSARLDGGETLGAALYAIFGRENVQIEAEETPAFSCDCSVERVEKALIALGREELTAMQEEDGGAEIECHFCNRKYVFTNDDLTRLIAEATRQP